MSFLQWMSILVVKSEAHALLGFWLDVLSLHRNQCNYKVTKKRSDKTTMYTQKTTEWTMGKSTGDVQCFKRKEAWGTCTWASSLQNNWKWKKITTSPPWMLFHGLVNQPGETCNNSSMNISICGFRVSSDTAMMRIGCFESYNRNVSIGIQERGNIRQGGLSLMQYLRSGSCSWQGWPRSSGLGCPGGACNEPGMPVAGGMAPPAMANASIFASSHKLQISQLDVGTTDSTRTRKIPQLLQFGNRTESLKLQLIYFSNLLQA